MPQIGDLASPSPPRPNTPWTPPVASSSDLPTGSSEETEFSVSIGDDLIAEALAAVERRAEESRAARQAEEDEEEDDVDVVFDDGLDDSATADLEGMTVDLGDLDSLMANAGALDASDASEELLQTREALEATRDALEVAEQAVLAAEAERDEALTARTRARRTAKKYKVAMEREAEQRQRLGSTQKLLRDRLSRAEGRLEDSEAERKTLVESVQVLTADVERAQRDVRRLKKREDQAKAAARRKAVERTCKELLPVLDNLELALAHASSDPARVLPGVQMVARQFISALGNVGLARVDATPGAPFDPAQHEATQTIPSVDLPAGSIHSELQAGFMFDGHLLRAARVAVSYTPATSAPADAPPTDASPSTEAAPAPSAAPVEDPPEASAERPPDATPDSPPPTQSVPEVASEPDPT